MSVNNSFDETANWTSAAPAGEGLGEWCVREGLTTAEEVDSCVKIQRASGLAGKPPPRLEDILVARGILTPHQVAVATAALKKVGRSRNPEDLCSNCLQKNPSDRPRFGDEGAVIHEVEGSVAAPEVSPVPPLFAQALGGCRDHPRLVAAVVFSVAFAALLVVILARRL